MDRVLGNLDLDARSCDRRYGIAQVQGRREFSKVDPLALLDHAGHRHALESHPALS